MHKPTTLIKYKPIYFHESKGFTARRRETAIAKAQATLSNVYDEYLAIQQSINDAMSITRDINDALVLRRGLIKKRYSRIWHRLVDDFGQTIERQL